METLDSARVTRGEGVLGDYRGALAAQKPGRKRQVSLIERACWEAAVSGTVMSKAVFGTGSSLSRPLRPVR